MDVTTQLELSSIKLTEGVLLKGVEVKGKKPPYQQEMDGLRINVENSAVSAGGTALEGLERSPGISVDRQNGNISLAGKESYRCELRYDDWIAKATREKGWHSPF